MNQLCCIGEKERIESVFFSVPFITMSYYLTTLELKMKKVVEYNVRDNNRFVQEKSETEEDYGFVEEILNFCILK